MDGTAPQTRQSAETSTRSSEPRTGRQASSRATVTTSRTVSSPTTRAAVREDDEANTRGTERMPIGRGVTGERPSSPRRGERARHAARRGRIERGHDLGACPDESARDHGEQRAGSGHEHTQTRTRRHGFEQIVQRGGAVDAGQRPAGNGHASLVGARGEDDHVGPHRLRAIPLPYRERALLEDAPHGGAADARRRVGRPSAAPRAGSIGPHGHTRGRRATGGRRRGAR